jgi:hypothetical protein
MAAVAMIFDMVGIQYLGFSIKYSGFGIQDDICKLLFIITRLKSGALTVSKLAKANKKYHGKPVTLVTLETG